MFVLDKKITHRQSPVIDGSYSLSYHPPPSLMGLCRFFTPWFAAVALLNSSVSLVAAASPTISSDNASANTDPVITSVRGRNVHVSVPAGFDRVVLQVARPARQRKASDAVVWKTVATKYPHREASAVTFRVPRLTPKRHLRVFGNQDEVLPGSFFTGFTNFL